MLRTIAFTVSVVVSALFVDLPTALAQFYFSQLQSLSRVSAQAGQAFDLSLGGDKLDEVVELSFSNPAIHAELKTLDPLPFTTDRQPQYGNFTVHIPADTLPGRYEVRAVGRHGVTNPRSFYVTQLPVDAPVSVSHDRSAPTELSRDRFVQSFAVPQSLDWYSLDINEADAFQIDMLAQQLDSAMIGQLRLYNANKQFIASARGSDDIDPTLSLVGLGRGRYLLSVQDFVFRGGVELPYMIVVRDADSATNLVAPAPNSVGQLPAVWFARAAIEPVIAASMPEETENSTEPVAIEIPSELRRWFSAGPTDHVFEFTAKQASPVSIEVLSQRIGQPTDPRLMIQQLVPQTDGLPTTTPVANSDDGPNISDGAVSLFAKDPSILFSPPADATYRCVIRDLDIGTSLREQQMYQLRLRNPDPRFDLVAYRVYPHSDVNASQAFASKLFRGGAEMIRVFAFRRDGWDGPINVMIDRLPDGVTSAEATIAANQNSTDLVMVASEQAAGRIDAVQIKGHSEDGTLSSDAVAVTMVRGRSHGRNSISTRVTTGLPVFVSESDLSPLGLTLGDGNVAEVKIGAALELPIRIVRREGGNTPCLFRPRNFPGGIAAGEVTIAADANEGKIELKVNGDTKPGTYSIWLQAETKIKVRANPQALERALAYRAQLQSLHDDPAQAANLESIQAAIIEADKLVEAAKPQANEQELTVFIPTNHTTIRVVQP